MRSCLPSHNFVNISLRLYACRAGPPCRDLGYRLPGSRLKRADFSHINRKNGPAHLLHTRSIKFGAVSQRIFPGSFNFTQKNDGTWLPIAGLAHFRIHFFFIFILNYLNTKSLQQFQNKTRKKKPNYNNTL